MILLNQIAQRRFQIRIGIRIANGESGALRGFVRFVGYAVDAAPGTLVNGEAVVAQFVELGRDLLIFAPAVPGLMAEQDETAPTGRLLNRDRP